MWQAMSFRFLFLRQRTTVFHSTEPTLPIIFTLYSGVRCVCRLSSHGRVCSSTAPFLPAYVRQSAGSVAGVESIRGLESCDVCHPSRKCVCLGHGHSWLMILGWRCFGPLPVLSRFNLHVCMNGSSGFSGPHWRSVLPMTCRVIWILSWRSALCVWKKDSNKNSFNKIKKTKALTSRVYVHKTTQLCFGMSGFQTRQSGNW